MDFAPTEEQELLRATARAFLEEKAPMTLARSLLEDAKGSSPALWKQMAELGWVGLTIPESYGGAGLSIVDQVLVLEEMGRALAPVPYLPTLAAVTCLLELGDEEQKRDWLPRIADGSTVATLAITEERGSDEPGDLSLAAQPTHGGFSLEGRKLFVPDAHCADLFVVVARVGGSGEQGLALFLVPADAPGLRIEPQPAMDPLRRLAELRFDEVTLPRGARMGGEVETWPGLRRTLDRVLVMISAEMLGGAQKCLDDSVAYAKERIQFGKPIGVNQAIKHKCADMLSAVESLRSLTHYAAWAAQEGHESAPQSAAMAKACAGESYRHCAKESIQIHGGVGYTWEYDCHLYLKRAMSDDAWLGDSKQYHERIARLMSF